MRSLLCLALLAVLFTSAYAWWCDLDIVDKEFRTLWKQKKECEWDLDKKVLKVDKDHCDNDPRFNNRVWQLPRGKCLTARYKLTANRKCTIVDEKFSVKVKLCIKNKGDQTTKNLRIFLKLQKKCNKLWEDVEKFEMKTTNRECKPHNHVECFEDQIYVPKDCKIDHKCEFRVVAIVKADNHKGCNEPCEIEKEKEEIEFPRKPTNVDYLKGKCARIVDEDNFCDEIVSCKNSVKYTHWEVCTEDLDKRHFDEHGRDCGEWKKEFTRKICNDLCRIKCERKKKLCNVAKLFMGKPNKWEWIPSEKTEACLKVRVKCRGGERDKFGFRCGDDDEYDHKDDKKNHKDFGNHIEYEDEEDEYDYDDDDYENNFWDKYENDEFDKDKDDGFDRFDKDKDGNKKD